MKIAILVKNKERTFPMSTVMIGMSGGVDSSVAAHLMLKDGCICIGCNMILTDAAGVDDARAICDRFGIPFRTMELREEFSRLVKEHFAHVYETGGTPNPCIRCNCTLKFGIMLDRALDQGCDAIVTGHYARILQDPETGRYLLYKAADAAKDQTYFLYGLTQHQLAHSRFPLGGLTKVQVRQLAEELGLLNARKKDSQDICFVPGGDYMAFLESFRNKEYPRGSFLDIEGKTIGTHRGAVAYTLGQRKGLGLAMGAPVYVCGKDMGANTVTVGPNEALFSPGLLAKDLNWIPFENLTEPLKAAAKIRHSQKEYPCTVYPLEDGRVRVVFEEPQRAISPGQAVVFYRDDLVLGGGTISSALKE